MIKIGDLVRVKNISYFKQTSGGAELLKEVFTVFDVVEDAIFLIDCNEVILDDIFHENELIKV